MEIMHVHCTPTLVISFSVCMSSPHSLPVLSRVIIGTSSGEELTSKQTNIQTSTHRHTCMHTPLPFHTHSERSTYPLESPTIQHHPFQGFVCKFRKIASSMEKDYCPAFVAGFDCPGHRQEEHRVEIHESLTPSLMQIGTIGK